MVFYIILFAFVTAVSTAILTSRQQKRNQKALQEYEKNQPTIEFYKILPFKVEELKVEQNQKDLFELTFTPISVKQMEENIFSIYIKSKIRSDVVEFELFLYDKVVSDEDLSSENYSFSILHTVRKGSDNLIRVLAKLFNIELKDSAQINRETYLFTQPDKINIDLLFEPFHRRYFLFSDAKVYPSPCIDIDFDLRKGYFKIIETDLLYRPLIIEKLLFRKNIKP